MFGVDLALRYQTPSVAMHGSRDNLSSSTTDLSLTTPGHPVPSLARSRSESLGYPSALTQFQARYPMGSLTADLLTINDGKYVVKASIQMGGVTLATGMAADFVMEQAEDRARLRALEVLGIYPEPPPAPDVQNSAYEFQVHLRANHRSETEFSPPTLRHITQPEAQLPEAIPSPLRPALGTQEKNLWTRLDQSGTVPTKPAIAEDVFPDFSLPEDPEEGFFEPRLEELEPSPEPRRPANGRVKSQPLDLHLPASEELDTPTQPITHTKPVPRPAPKSTQSPQSSTTPTPLDLSDAIAQTSLEIRRLGWTEAQGRSYLQKAYGKRSRQQLTDEELIQFLHHLQSQPSPTESPF